MGKGQTRTLTIRLNASETKELASILDKTGIPVVTELFRHFLKLYPESIENRIKLLNLQKELSNYKAEKEKEIKQAEAKYLELKNSILLLKNLE